MYKQILFLYIELYRDLIRNKQKQIGKVPYLL